MVCMQKQHQSKEERERQRQKRAERCQIKEAKKSQKIIRRGDVEQLTFWGTLVNDFKDAPFSNLFIVLSSIYVTVISLIQFDVSIIFWLFIVSTLAAFMFGLLIGNIFSFKDDGRMIDTFMMSISPLFLFLITIPVFGFIALSYLATGTLFHIALSEDVSLWHVIAFCAGIGSGMGYTAIGRLLAVWRDKTTGKSRKGKVTHE